MKDIVKPTLMKIVLAFVLLFIFSWLWGTVVRLTISDTFPIGFPLQFFLSWGPCPLGTTCSESNGLWLVVDLIFWYLVSAFLLYRFQKSSRSYASKKNTTE